ncbi:MAG: hypothetical protein ACK4XJ_10775 [Fimbriimonadaceae bacterium]
MLAVLSIAASTITFEGGNDQDLVRALAKQTGKSVWTVVDPERTWPKFEAEYDPEKDDLAQVVGSSLKCDTVLTEKALILRPSWSMAYLSQQKRIIYSSEIERRILGGHQPREVAEVAGDQIKFDPKGVPHPLYRVVPTGTENRLTWHWFFEGAWLAIDGPGLTLRDYMSALARALGGVAREVPNVTRIDLDGNEFRRRAIATYSELSNGTQAVTLLPIASAKYSAAVYERLTGQQLYDAFRDPTKETLFPELASDSHVQTLARIRLREDKKIDVLSTDPGDSGIPANVYAQFDFGGAWTPLIFPSTGQVASYMRSRDGKANIAF